MIGWTHHHEPSALRVPPALPPTGLARTERFAFGVLPDGRRVDAVRLANNRGMSATILAYGARLQALTMPDRSGIVADIAAGYATLEGYLADPHYMGATIGRFANRIAGGSFSLDGEQHRVSVNESPHSLHGGTIGFDKRLWKIGAIAPEPSPCVTLHLFSPHGDQGYPGALRVSATYALDDECNLSIEYAAETDRPTIVSLTNHVYWDLAGEGAGELALGHELTMPADHYLRHGPGGIPEGAPCQVAGSAFDFRLPASIRDQLIATSDQQLRQAGGYDHTWVQPACGDRAPQWVATLRDPVSGRSFELFSNQPGLQLYTGNFLDGRLIGKSGKPYRKGEFLALEPQSLPDAPNRPDFPSARLDPGQDYRHVMVYRFRIS